jgi:N-acetylmuramoyl-L-alanine amidase
LNSQRLWAGAAGAWLAVGLLLAGCGSGHSRADTPDLSTDTTTTTDESAASDPFAASTVVVTTTSAVPPSGTSTPPPSSVLSNGRLAHVAGRTIAIDAGHNGGNAAHPAEINALVDAGNGVHKECDTTGTAGDDGYAEYSFNLSVAQAVRDELVAAGAHVVMVRDDSNGWGPCITQRAAIGNNAHADAAISIHADGNLAVGARGFHVILPAVSAGGGQVVSSSATLGGEIRDHVSATGMPESNYMGAAGLITRGDLGGLNLSTVPKVFVECGNMRNPADLAMLEDPTWRNQLAVAIATGFDAYLAG